jgi:hypothetical protein
MYQQVRRVVFGSGLTAVADGSGNDLDMDVSVRATSESLNFEIGLWNLNDSDWQKIEKQSTVSIQLGWAESEVEQVCFGEITKTFIDTKNNNADTRYVVKGTDASLSLFSAKISKTYKDEDPGAIARDLASEVGADVGVIESVGEKIDGRWPVKDDRSVRHWLRQLRNEAGKMDDEQWIWSARRGKLHFHRKSTTINQTVRLWSDRNEGNLQAAGHATGGSSQDGARELRFEAYLEPMIRKNGTVELESRVASGEFRVAEVEFISDTVSGDHRTTGTLVPLGAQYSAPYPGGDEFKERLLQKSDKLKKFSP